MEVIEKPWGKEEILTIQDNYVVKRLTMLSGKRCSLQYHEKKTETIYVVSGILLIHMPGGVEEMHPGDSITILPGIQHRMEVEDMDGFSEAVYLECSTTELDDVVRIEDDYGRE